MTPPGWKCPKRIGFLFPHACTRLTPEGCQDCQNGQIADPYVRRTDRYSYSDYDYYDDSNTGYVLGAIGLEAIGDRYDHRFTEADGESLVTPDDKFENDLSAS
jgi:hypothetical protein